MKKIEKPWGMEEILEINKNYMLKRLTMNKNAKCSLQYHNQKRETIYILSGKLKIYFGSSESSLDSKVFTTGDCMTIDPGVIHRMEGIEKSVYLESSTPELEDVVRLKDDYNRNTI